MTPPKVELPAGGGALRGIGETFAANPVTGTGAMTVPIATSPGRGGFGPRLALAYDSGSGNGPFGFGWSLDLPSITRRTEKGLPEYDDAGESDVFLLAGSDELVPVLAPDGSRFEDRAGAPGHVIHRYRPRIEGPFARIERWTRVADADVHWRAYGRDNALTVYGQDASARVFDPANPAHVFSWLVCEERDDRGNAVLFTYKSEDGSGVDLTRAHERNRGDADDPRRAVNRYIKRIRYGNRRPMLDASGRRPHVLDAAQVLDGRWMFEVVFDYGEHDLTRPRPDEDAAWTCRADAFSSCRPGFEVRTSRRCQRVLMFHHFEDEPEIGLDRLVRSTDIGYGDATGLAEARRPVHSFLASVTQCGYRRSGAGYLRRTLPPVEFEYSAPTVQGAVQDVDAASLEHMPGGVTGTDQWIDLHGEGVPGFLTEQAGAWYYKRNLSPLRDGAVAFAPVERVASRPNFALAGGALLADATGDGVPDLVVPDGPMPGFHAHDLEEGWAGFRPIASPLARDTRDPYLRFVDLNGDGHADALITEDDAFVWHPSLGEAGFGPARRVPYALDEEHGPRLVFADPAQSIHLADMNGDDLVDLVRIRNGEVCYWPQLGHGRFGAKVTMDRAPRFDRPDAFDQRRIRVADIDGSGAADLIYLGAAGVTLYFNQSGNAWSAAETVAAFPAVDDLAAIQVADLMGNGTACLVWSSPLPAHSGRSLRYVDLMGAQKPYLLVHAVNNLGAETAIHYAPSTRFYLLDKFAGRPWITKLPFPVHVVERVETVDRVSGNRFVTRYAYHHGCFDGAEREFRGFGMVEQFDTAEYAMSTGSGSLAVGTNDDVSSHVPPVLTRTWFHTGLYVDREHVSNVHAGLVDDDDQGEYYRELDSSDDHARALLLDDTVLPAGLTLEEEREACRTLKGAMLRREVYGLDGSERAAHPYVVTEQNFTIRVLQSRGANRHAVFFTHPRESIAYHYERDPGNPRVAHAVTLAVDDVGNVLASAAVAYGRRETDPALAPADQARQAERYVTATENAFTNAIDSSADWRTPLAGESRGYELSGLPVTTGIARLTFDQLLDAVSSASPIAFDEAFTAGRVQKRLITHARTLYRPDDLGAARHDVLALLPPGRLESRALAGESYQLALTPGLVAQVLGDKVDEGLLDAGRYTHSEGDPGWWARSGRVFLSPDATDDPAAELGHARQHFFLPHRFRDPFHADGFDTETVVTYDVSDLLVHATRDALGNVASALHDYRVLQPRLLTDANGNRSEVAFDALGMVVGSAVMGKSGESKGDSLLGFGVDLDEAAVLANLDDPFADPLALLQRASTRILYDLFAYRRSSSQAQPQPAVACTLLRETHDADLAEGEQPDVQHRFAYSDGFGRVIQKKLQAEPGPLVPGGADVSPRWVGSGWTIFDNKGNPVRRYEPFFSATHRFEFAHVEGVCPVRFYDPVGRVVATLRPDHSWEKVVVESWREERWDVNDTILIDPGTDEHVGDCFRRLGEGEYRPGWYERRSGGAMGPFEQTAALRTAVHAATPHVVHLDALGRSFLDRVHNRFRRSDAPPTDPPQERFQPTRVVFDIQGNQREVVDALDRVIVRHDHDLLGNPVHSASMEAGERWTLNDAAGRAFYAWNSRGDQLRTSHDVLGRSFEAHLQSRTGPERLVGRTRFGEGEPDAAAGNLRGRPFQVFDGAGVVTTPAYDFKANALVTTRQVAIDYKTAPDWSAAVPLEAEVYTSRTSFDALNRPLSQTAPDASTVRRAYNEANLLESIEANLRGDMVEGQPVWTPFVTRIDYDAKGQRQRMVFGNGVVTDYEYDPLTFRLLGLRTSNDDQRLQDLSYTYDPAGNVTHVEDRAQPAIYFRNVRVEASNDYTYDAAYQLIEATGREHLGQLGGRPGAPVPPDAFHRFHAGLPHPGDGRAMGRYIERYTYDPAGNFLDVRHVGSDPVHPGWTRAYRYDEVSPLDLRHVSNRVSSTQVGDGALERYTYDAHGCSTAMPHLPLMRWNYLDQLEASAQQVVNAGTPETTYYVYDASGQRARKVTDGTAAPDATPARAHERLYLDGWEIHREYDGSDVVSLERETLSVMDDQRCVALIETRTRGNDGSPAQLTRYRHGNHLGSVCVELDDAGQVVTYEECFPFGATSYQALDSSLSAAAKRYRFTGCERDEESGLSYHRARYYASWLGRWTSPDAAGLRDSPNLYVYVTNNPTRLVDSTGRAGKDQTWGEYFASYASAEAWRESILELNPMVPAFESLGAVNRGEYVDADYEVERTMDSTLDLITAVVSLAGAGLNPSTPAVRASGPAASVGREIVERTASGGVKRMASFGESEMTIPLRRGLNQAAEQMPVHIGAGEKPTGLCVASVCASFANEIRATDVAPFSAEDIVRISGQDVNPVTAPLKDVGEAWSFADKAFKKLAENKLITAEVALARAESSGNPPGTYMVILKYFHAIRADVSNTVVTVQHYFQGNRISAEAVEELIDNDQVVNTRTIYRTVFSDPDQYKPVSDVLPDTIEAWLRFVVKKPAAASSATP